jgi:hypothetical protein
MSVHRYIRLKSGRKFYFRRPTTAQLNLPDIIWSLSHMPRFLGHTIKPYFTLHHCCLVHDLAPVDCRREALAHDFMEHALSDIVSPCKVLLPDYLDMEHKHEKVMARKFGLRHPFPSAVKVADLTALATEMKCLTNRRDYRDLPYPPSDITIVPWTSAKCRVEFMKRWNACSN